MKAPSLISSRLASSIAWDAFSPASAQQHKEHRCHHGDDIGMWNIGAYHRGVMAGRTPNLDRSPRGMLFTDYYAEASCTAGRANFITAADPHRHDHGRPSWRADRLPAEAVTTAQYESMGYATASSARHHLGRQERILPTSTASMNSSDIYITSTRWRPGTSQLPAEPAQRRRSAQHGFIAGPPTRMTPPRCRDGARSACRGSRMPARSTPADGNGGRRNSRPCHQFHGQGQEGQQTLLFWLNRRACTSHASVSEIRSSAQFENGWSEEEAGMAQLDDDVGLVMKNSRTWAWTTIPSSFHHRQRHEVFTWPDGGQTPFAQSKGTVLEGGFRVPCMIRWPGHVSADTVQNGNLLRLGLVCRPSWPQPVIRTSSMNC